MSQRNEYPSLDTAPAGAIRFNTDSGKMEIYNGEAWWNIDSTSPNEQTGGTRGLFGGGETPSLTDRIDFINVDLPQAFVPNNKIPVVLLLSLSSLL